MKANARKSSARLSTQQKQSLEKNLKRVCKKYGALLANPKKQTWVRFAKEDEVEGRADLPAQGIKFSSPVHEQRVEIGTNEEQVGDVYNSIMQGVDPACESLSLRVFVRRRGALVQENGQNEDVESNSSEGSDRLSDDGDLALKGVQNPAFSNQPWMNNSMAMLTFFTARSSWVGLEIPALRSESSWRNGTVSFPTIYNRKRCRAEVKSLTPQS